MKTDLPTLEAAADRIVQLRVPQTIQYQITGLIRAPIGVYRVSQMSDGHHLLTFAESAEDMEPDSRTKGRIYPIAVENPHDPNWAEHAINAHQTDLETAILNQRTLYRVDDDMWLGGTASYRLIRSPVPGPERWEVHLVEGSHRAEDVALPPEERPGVFQRLRMPTCIATLERPAAERLVVSDFHKRQGLLLAGKDILGDQERRSWLTPTERTISRMLNLGEDSARMSTYIAIHLVFAVFSTRLFRSATAMGGTMRALPFFSRSVDAVRGKRLKPKDQYTGGATEKDLRCATTSVWPAVRAYPPIDIGEFGPLTSVGIATIAPQGATIEPHDTLADLLDRIVDPLQGQGGMVADIRDPDKTVVHKGNGIVVSYNGSHHSVAHLDMVAASEKTHALPPALIALLSGGPVKLQQNLRETRIERPLDNAAKERGVFEVPMDRPAAQPRVTWLWARPESRAHAAAAKITPPEP